ncbi:MAG: class I SAM-dependent methyltransferase [Anaerolineales bacterium]|nr:class I SAM-dependent methyltransferase [Anaerolineales bacterium]
MPNSIDRFTNRADNYARYRPTYPPEAIAWLVHSAGLKTTDRIADIGSGTGILTELLLRNGNEVLAVEPNPAMRALAERNLSDFPGFHSIAGTAEATTLPDQAVDWITAAQAFHWFDPVSARREFDRILKPGGKIALIWNSRRESGTPFLDGYQQVIDTFNTDRAGVDFKFVVDGAALDQFFGASGFREFTCVNVQVLDWDGLLGRIASTSFMPSPDTPGFAAMAAQLRAVFERCAVHGQVEMIYDTELYVSRDRGDVSPDTGKN